MLIDRRLLAIIGRRIPAIYDVIPRGPQSRLAQVALNPHPLPPHELGAAIASEFLQLAWMAERMGSDPAIAFDDLDDWCPTVPKRPKFPPWWPPLPEPDPHPDWLIDMHLGFAARIAAKSGDFPGSRLEQVLDKAIERSVSAIEAAEGRGGRARETATKAGS